MNFIVIAFRLFSSFSENISKYFMDVKIDLKKANIRYSLQEYLSIATMLSFIIFLVQLPLLSFVFGLIFRSFLFSFIFAITLSIISSILTFLFTINYPKIIISNRAKQIDSSLPFSTMYLSTVARSKLPLYKIFEIFSRFVTQGELTRQISDINEDVRLFGLDINTALERGVERSPSKNFKELLYGILSTVRSGADLSIFLKEKADSFIVEYRRKLYEFSHSLTIFIEVYLTSIVLGVIFFTILTAIISGIAGAAENLVILQFFLVFVFIPLISILFIFFVRAITPVGE